MSALDNPPAFPSAYLGDTRHPFSSLGMTLRDWFAGQALAGLAVRSFDHPFSDVAETAYEYADSMLAERAKVQS